MKNPEGEELLTSRLASVDRAVAYAARRHRLDREDAEEFAAIVRLRLVENDYAILRAYEERSRFDTYISIVVQRMALDYRIHAWGKWHPSAEAKRLGPLAIDLERLLRRDGRSLDEALTILAPKHEGVTREQLEALAARFPDRAPRMHPVALEEAEPVADTRPAQVEERVLARERQRESERVSQLMTEVIGRLPDDDRLILQLRFEGAMTVAQISRMLRIEQKLLYRRIEKCMASMKRELERKGVAADDVTDLIGRDETLLVFDLGKREGRPSIPGDETVAHTEDLR